MQAPDILADNGPDDRKKQALKQKTPQMMNPTKMSRLLRSLQCR